MSIQETSSAGWWRHIRLPLVLLAAILIGGGLVVGAFMAFNGGRLPIQESVVMVVPTPDLAALLPTDTTSTGAIADPHGATTMPTADPAATALPNPHGGDPAAAPVQRLAVADAKVRFDAGSAVFVDLRSGADFAKGHVAKALSITSMDLEEQLKALPATTVVVVYGESSAASSTGAQIFRDTGVANVAALDGDFDAWQAQGFPVATGAN